ncbi:MAG: MarR family transcriptional regulator [Sphingomicrobium sp.]
MIYAARLADPAMGSPRAHLPPALVIGSSAAARARGVAEIEAAGLRLAAAVPVEEAIERIDQQAAASALWIELDRDQGGALDALLERVDRDADAGAYAAIVSTELALLDPVAARLTSSRVELLVGGAPSERVAALGLACSLPPGGKRLSDVAADNGAARLRQLSEDVGRIAATLARLSAGPDAPAALPAERSVSAGAPTPEVTREEVRAVIRRRRLRARFFPEDLFADPAWDMLLDLTQAEIAQIRVPVSSLCIAAAVPATTALRWIKTLTDNGVFVRRPDPHDGRRVFVEMAPNTSSAMRRYFAEVGRMAA